MSCSTSSVDIKIPHLWEDKSSNLGKKLYTHSFVSEGTEQIFQSLGLPSSDLKQMRKSVALLAINQEILREIKADPSAEKATQIFFVTGLALMISSIALGILSFGLFTFFIAGLFAFKTYNAFTNRSLVEQAITGSYNKIQEIIPKIKSFIELNDELMHTLQEKINKAQRELSSLRILDSRETKMRKYMEECKKALHEFEKLKTYYQSLHKEKGNKQYRYHQYEIFSYSSD